MIHSVGQLAVVQKQLARAERALKSLRDAVLPKNPRNFAILSEGYVDHIAALKAEIRAYKAKARKKGRASVAVSPNSVKRSRHSA